jgi:8-oxo-dGTP pyrophosphatase MutT (NUDIX family)
MRNSKAALAIIEQSKKWLVQWNGNWDACSLIGGHVESGETFHECCKREIIEELECEVNQFELAQVPIMVLRFRKPSEAAGEETDYEWQIFKTELDDSVLAYLPTNCAWVTPEQIRKAFTEDGKPIAGQVKRVLQDNENFVQPIQVAASLRDAE